MRVPKSSSLWIAWAGFVLLIVLHLDFWRPQRVVLYFGWVPEELLYRIGWMFLAWAYLLFFCTVIWRDEPEERDEPPDEGEQRA